MLMLQMQRANAKKSCAMKLYSRMRKQAWTRMAKKHLESQAGIKGRVAVLELRASGVAAHCADVALFLQNTGRAWSTKSCP